MTSSASRVLFLDGHPDATPLCAGLAARWVTRYILSPLARVDLNKIWDYTAKRWDENQAEAYLRLIQAAIEIAAESPLLSPAIDDVRPGYRRHRAGTHLIPFRQIAGAIDVVRVLHEKMDVASHSPDIS